MSRPKEFDPEIALNKAMEVFWTQGFEATSVQDLVDAMGINRFSIYSTFGDKHQLYLASLARYRHLAEGALLERLQTSGGGLTGLETFFRQRVEELASGPECARGCLMASCSSERAADDEAAAEEVRQGLSSMEFVFGRAIREAQERGEIAGQRDATDLARFLAGVHTGLLVLAKARPGREFLASLAETALSILRSPEPAAEPSLP